MSEFDKLPKILRIWLNYAALPWKPKSVHRAYKKAFLRTGDPILALKDLDRVQEGHPWTWDTWRRATGGPHSGKLKKRTSTVSRARLFEGCSQR